jgi:hypothetical protein
MHILNNSHVLKLSMTICAKGAKNAYEIALNSNRDYTFSVLF